MRQVLPALIRCSTGIGAGRSALNRREEKNKDVTCRRGIEKSYVNRGRSCTVGSKRNERCMSVGVTKTDSSISGR